MATITFESVEDYVSRRYSMLDQFESLEGIMGQSLAKLKDFSTGGLLSAVPFEQVLSHYLLSKLVAETKQYQADANKAWAWKEDPHYLLKITIPHASLEDAMRFLDTVHQRNFPADTPVWLLAKDPGLVEQRRNRTLLPGESLSNLLKVSQPDSGLDIIDYNSNYDAFKSPSMAPVKRYCGDYPRYVRTITIRSSTGVAVARINHGGGQENYNILVSLSSLISDHLIDLSQTAEPFFKAVPSS